MVPPARVNVQMFIMLYRRQQIGTRTRNLDGGRISGENIK